MSASWYGNTVDSISATNATITNATITNDTVTTLNVTTANFANNAIAVNDNLTAPTAGQEMLLPYAYLNAALGPSSPSINAWLTPNGWTTGPVATWTAGKYLFKAQLLIAYGGGAWATDDALTFQIRTGGLTETVFPEVTVRPYYAGGTAAGTSGGVSGGSTTMSVPLVGILDARSISSSYFFVRVYYSASTGRTDHSVTLTSWAWQKFQST